MASNSQPFVPFSQRTGLEPIPPQLKLGEASAELRRLLYYYISLEIDRESYATYSIRGVQQRMEAGRDRHRTFSSSSCRPNKFDYGAYKEEREAP